MTPTNDAATVTAVTDDEVTIPTTGYATESAAGWPIIALSRIDGDPWKGPVDVTGTWGWSAVPDAVKHAACLISARMFKRSQLQYGQPDNAAGGLWMPRFDPDVSDLLQPYVRPRFGPWPVKVG